MGYPAKEKRRRSAITWGVFIVVVILAFLGIIYFDNLSALESENFV